MRYRFVKSEGVDKEKRRAQVLIRRRNKYPLFRVEVGIEGYLRHHQCYSCPFNRSCTDFCVCRLVESRIEDKVKELYRFPYFVANPRSLKRIR